VTLKARRKRPDPRISRRGRLLTKRKLDLKNDIVKQKLLREARQHLERAQALDPEGVVAQAFVHKVRPSV